MNQQLRPVADQKEIQRLVRGAKSRSGAKRREAAEKLASLGDAAVIQLCEQLKHSDTRVREQAAIALAEAGDVRAVQPLLDALRDSFVARSSKLNVVLGIVLLPALALLSLLGLVATGVVAAGLLFLAAKMEFKWFDLETMFAPVKWLWGAVTGPFDWLKERRSRRTCSAIAQALLRIAERTATPELRNALPDLQGIAADLVQQDEVTREVARQAADRIEALTSQLQSLPRATSNVGSIETLPIAADQQTPSKEHLPSAAEHRNPQSAIRNPES